mmetsp:Transcript_29703/g.93734  ORF Transcript_29703/g.93734 Transcript_29703/m.93734 type:complete len:264 (+) Transcript_29703:475-1266(+)
MELPGPLRGPAAGGALRSDHGPGARGRAAAAHGRPGGGLPDARAGAAARARARAAAAPEVLRRARHLRGLLDRGVRGAALQLRHDPAGSEDRPRVRAPLLRGAAGRRSVRGRGPPLEPGRPGCQAEGAGRARRGHPRRGARRRQGRAHGPRGGRGGGRKPQRRLRRAGRQRADEPPPAALEPAGRDAGDPRVARPFGGGAPETAHSAGLRRARAAAQGDAALAGGGGGPGNGRRGLAAAAPAADFWRLRILTGGLPGTSRCRG